MNLLRLNRWHMAALHGLATVVVGGGLGYLVLDHTLPSFFFKLDGGWPALTQLLLVLLVLGPLLTLVVYRPHKPGLRLDLTLIGLVQGLGLVVGVAAIYNERTTFLVYYEQHFYGVNDRIFADHNLATPDFRDFGVSAPAIVYVDVPSDPVEEANLRRILYQDRLPLWAYPKLYRPLPASIDAIIDESATESVIRARDVAGNMDGWIERHGGQFSDYAFVPIHSRFQDSMMGIRRSDQHLVDVVNIPLPVFDASDEH